MSRAHIENKRDDMPVLHRSARGLELVYGDVAIRGDFTKMLHRIRPKNLHRELLVRAAKVHAHNAPPLAIDATAGLGEDALLLAATGFEVHLYEHNATIAALLRDTLMRAKEIPELATIVCRMHLHEQDSTAALPKLLFTPDLIVLDPMFPERRTSAASRKKAQFLQKLEKPCDDGALLQAAIAAHPHKIVCKRPLKGAYLADMPPTYSIRGTTIRYDCIVLT